MRLFCYVLVVFLLADAQDGSDLIFWCFSLEEERVWPWEASDEQPD